MCEWGKCSDLATHAAYQQVRPSLKRHLCFTHVLELMEKAKRMGYRGMVYDKVAA